MLKTSAVRDGYFRVDRVHPITGERIYKKGRNELVLLRWAAEVDQCREELKAGLISRTEALRRLSVQDTKLFTVQDAWEEFFPTIKHNGTRRAYAAAWEQRLREQLGSKALEELTDDAMEEWFRTCMDTVTTRGSAVSVKTVDNAYQALKAAIKRQLGKRIQVMPWLRFTVKVPKHQDLPTEREACRSFEEMQRLIRGAAEEDAILLATAHGPKFADLAVRVGILLLTGMRVGEAAALGFDDVETRGGTPHLNIRHQVLAKWREQNPEWDRPKDPPKTGRALVAVHPDVLVLLEYQKTNLMARGAYRPDGPVFPGKNGTWREHPRLIDPDRMRQLVQKYLPEADWKNFVTHSTRHSFATVIAVAMQGDEKAAMKLTRHRDETVYRQYRHMAGRGITENPLPRTNVELVRQGPPLLPMGDYPPTEEWKEGEDKAGDRIVRAGIAEIIAITPERAAHYEAVQAAARREAQNAIKSRYKASNATDFDAAWRHWTLAGRPGERPFQVTAAMTLAYDRTRKDVARRNLEGRRNVQKNERTWEAICRHNLNIPIDKGVPPECIETIKGLNQGREKPPAAGNAYTVPSEWEARKRARASRRAVVMAWANFLKKRDGTALRTGECTDDGGKVRFVDASVVTNVGEVAGEQEESDNETQEAAADDE